MRVLFLITSSSLCDGIGTHLVSILRNFSSGVSSGVCITHGEGDLGRALKAIGVKVYALDCPHGHDFRIFPRFHKVVRDFKPDLIHGHVTPLFTALYLKYIRPGIPYLETLHGVPDNPAHPKGLARMKARILGCLLRKRADHYFAVSSNTRDWNVEGGLPANRITVAFNPVSLANAPEKDVRKLKSELKLSPETPVVGMVGRLAHVKDWPSFIHICKILAERHPTVHFVAVGEGPMEAELKAEADRCGLAQRLTWMGYRPDAKILIGGMDVYLLTSHKEGMPTVLLEAFMMRTPVAGFIPAGGVHDVIRLSQDAQGVSAQLVPDRDAAAVAGRVLDLLADPASIQAQTDFALRLVREHFDARIVCQTLEEHYSKTLGLS